MAILAFSIYLIVVIMDFIGFVLSLLVKFLVLLKLKEKEKGVEMIE